jgi:hypothetical protein
MSRGSLGTGARVAMIALAVPVAVIAALIGGYVWLSLTNDAAAREVEDRLVALPLPPGSERVDALSVAAKVTGNGNGMQYLGAMLIRSDLPPAELTAFYDAQDARDDPAVIATTDETELDAFHGARGFFDAPGEPGLYIVYAFGEAPSEIHEEFDIRGH